MKDQSHGWIKAQGFFLALDFWCVLGFFADNSCGTCIAVIAVIHRIQWLKFRRQATSQSRKTIFRMCSFYLPLHNPTCLPKPSQIEGCQVAISHLLGFGEELRSTLAVWDWQLQMAQLAKPPCILCPTIRHWKNVLGNRFFMTPATRDVFTTTNLWPFDQQLFRIRNQVWGVSSSSYLHMFCPLWLPFPLGSGSWHPKAAEQKLCPSPRRDTEWMLSLKLYRASTAKSSSRCTSTTLTSN